MVSIPDTQSTILLYRRINTGAQRQVDFLDEHDRPREYEQKKNNEVPVKCKPLNSQTKLSEIKAEDSVIEVDRVANVESRKFL